MNLKDSTLTVLSTFMLLFAVALVAVIVGQSLQAPQAPDDADAQTYCPPACGPCDFGFTRIADQLGTRCYRNYPGGAGPNYSQEVDNGCCVSGSPSSSASSVAPPPSAVCGNGVCESTETAVSCPVDCVSGSTSSASSSTTKTAEAFRCPVTGGAGGICSNLAPGTYVRALNCTCRTFNNLSCTCIARDNPTPSSSGGAVNTPKLCESSLISALGQFILSTDQNLETEAFVTSASKMVCSIEGMIKNSSLYQSDRTL